MDREEFSKKLDQLFCWSCKHSTIELMNALLANDTEALDVIRQTKVSLDARKQSYLDSFDAANTEEDKMVVVGSVTMEEL